MTHSTAPTRAKRARNLMAKSHFGLSPRTAPVLQRTRLALEEHGGYVTRSALIDGMLRAGDLAPRTVENLIGDAVTAGWLLKRGEYDQRTRVDSRTYALGDWPS